MVRSIALAFMQHETPKRVRICVQQSLGEGIFVGQPIALSSMRQVLERMDWGTLLAPEERFQPGDNTTPRKEALLRFGTVGADQVAPDDDVIIVIAPQNGTFFYRYCIECHGWVLISLHNLYSFTLRSTRRYDHGAAGGNGACCPGPDSDPHKPAAG